MLARLAWPLGMFLLSSCATVDTGASATPAAAPLAVAAQPVPGIEHTVRRGETLWRISRLYQTDLEDILRINNIPDSAVISVGQKIVIPATGSEITPSQDSRTTDNMDFIWPLKGEVVTSFKEKNGGVFSKGIDIRARAGDEILASQSGVVVFIGTLAGYGTTLIVDHAGNISTVYTGTTTPSVAKGQEVRQGAALAKITPPAGKNEGTLHFEIRNRHRPQNPLYYLK